MDYAATERIGKYLVVRKHRDDPSRKTGRWTVLTNHDDVLGVVQWFPRWRQYCFDPHDGTTFNDGCLRDLATFLARVTSAHRGVVPGAIPVALGPEPSVEE